jgi:hypothetical protein
MIKNEQQSANTRNTIYGTTYKKKKNLNRKRIVNKPIVNNNTFYKKPTKPRRKKQSTDVRRPRSNKINFSDISRAVDYYNSSYKRAILAPEYA